jgi:hypothetical protein
MSRPLRNAAPQAPRPLRASPRPRLRPLAKRSASLTTLILALAATLAASLATNSPALSQTVTSSQSGGVSDTNGTATFDNVQDNTGAIIGDAHLDVVENDGLTQATSYATGNSLKGGNDTADATVTSAQSNSDHVKATSKLNGVNPGQEDLSLGTPAYATSQAMANYSGLTTQGAHLTSQTTQTSSAPVEAVTDVQAPNNAIYISSQGDATAEANHTAYEVTNGRLDAKSWQYSSSDVQSNASATVHYSPSPNQYNASATGNYYGSLSTNAGSQEHETHQTQDGQTISRAEQFGGNMWDSATRSTAVANNVDLKNQGGSLVVSNDQSHTGYVQSQAVTTADQYGTARATATGVGNQLSAANNDVYVRVGNSQISSGGVDVSAEFSGNTGYDGYISAEAYGNQALAYACSECKADIGVNSNQVNNSDVNAVDNATINQGRSIVSTARATGNSATFYVSGGSGLK